MMQTLGHAPGRVSNLIATRQTRVEMMGNKLKNTDSLDSLAQIEKIGLGKIEDRNQPSNQY